MLKKSNCLRGVVSYCGGRVGVGGAADAEDAGADGGGRGGGGRAAGADHAGEEGADEGAGRGAAGGDILGGAHGRGSGALRQGQTGGACALSERTLKSTTNFSTFLTRRHFKGLK